MASPKLSPNIYSYGGVICIIAFGYFATIQGLNSAIHSPAILLAIGALLIGGIYSNKRPRRDPIQTGTSEYKQNPFRKISAVMSIASAIIFFIEINVSELKFREIAGMLALIIYLISFLLGIIGKSG